MAGYDWSRGKSNNAVDAEYCGKFPKSNITASLLKKYDIPLKLKDVKKLIELNIFISSEWHHTSSKFNETYFYDMELLKTMCEDEEEFKNIQDALKKDNDEDILYAKIEIVNFEKIKRNWKPNFTIVNAKVEGYYTKTMCRIIDENGNIFRKKVDNVRIINYVEIENYEMIVLEKKKKELKEEKLAKKARLEARKKNFLEEIEKSFKKIDDNLILKYNRARSLNTVEKIETVIKNEIELLKKEEFKQLKNIDISNWLLLPKKMKHPAPKNIYNMKVSSGLGWIAFEEYMKKNSISLNLI